MTRDEMYMRRALELAELGRGSVSPNPMVGCVIVYADQIIGEGYHRQYGEAHAEVNAIHSVKQPELLSEATAYVTLEPCAHFGKTPPCANLLVEKKIKSVVIATMDSNPLVGGKGVKILEDAGIKVKVGVLEADARAQNRRFFTQMNLQRPYIILKWAQTQDGFVARKDFSSKWISNPASRQMVHRWRAEEDAILVGKNTAKYDDPSLNVRDWVGNDPLRLVIDSRLELTKGLNLFNGTIPTICYNTQKSEKQENLEYVKLIEDFSLEELLSDLNQRKVQSLIVEGGAFLLNKFISAELWDEARVFTGQSKFGEGIPAPVLPSPSQNELELEGDILRFYYHV
ncbi:bifunctional diaminohydroxyphosphoribosylaminopyrimidine deaminase/5-amino-6-(5-phosphoribosylamino)uracil reductase RibD [Algoriphagus namhaensis]|uniref:Riboflavin biosynthesis protein RibD n=1 Tax=Algoriphagus namhaensis TaxID=915353 RepID=A0ABV8AQL1_9BACT